MLRYVRDGIAEKTSVIVGAPSDSCHDQAGGEGEEKVNKALVAAGNQDLFLCLGNDQSSGRKSLDPAMPEPARSIVLAIRLGLPSSHVVGIVGNDTQFREFPLAFTCALV